MSEPDAFDRLDDAAITSHGFAPYMRDYRVIAQRWTDEKPAGWWAYVFTHCVLAEVTTRLSDGVWADSWSTATDLATWEDSERAGFAWGVAWANVETAFEAADSEAAQRWTTRLGRQMREAVIETQVYRLRVVYFELLVEPTPEPGTSSASEST